MSYYKQLPADQRVILDELGERVKKAIPGIEIHHWSGSKTLCVDSHLYCHFNIRDDKLMMDFSTSRINQLRIRQWDLGDPNFDFKHIIRVIRYLRKRSE